MYEVLCQAQNITKTLHIEEVICVFDQALYAKAAEVIWKQPQQFSQIVLRLGAFHTICTLFAVIGKRFGDAGLRDVAIESGIIAERSVGSVVDGKQYNRGVRLHKIIYEALMRIVWKGFHSWLEDNHPDDLPYMNAVVLKMKELYDDLCQSRLNEVIQNESCARIFMLYNTYFEKLRKQSGQIASFWLSYIDIVDILLGLIRASREGNWQLHLNAIYSMIPWCFAYDRQNYARYLPIYYAQMTSLPKDHPFSYEHLQQGGLSVQRSEHNPFGKVPIDQTIE